MKREKIAAIDDHSRRKDAHVGKLVTIKISGTPPEWLIGIVNRIIKTASFDSDIPGKEDNAETNVFPIMKEINKVKVLLIGTYSPQKGEISNYFSRSILRLPDIESECYTLEGEKLGKFMNIISEKSKGNHALDIGHYTLDPAATAYLDGNKLFQRHAALRGSSGSGWMPTNANLSLLYATKPINTYLNEAKPILLNERHWKTLKKLPKKEGNMVWDSLLSVRDRQKSVTLF